MLGQWEPIVDELTWLAVQGRLDDPRRITNRSGSTTRRHLGSGLYLCGGCEVGVRAHSGRYRCPECHTVRTRAHVDDWVLKIIRARLARPDLSGAIPSRDELRLRAIQAEIDDRMAKIQRAQRDNDTEAIEGFDL